ncbi:MAG: hypothetical protein QNI87_03905 [Erythrobacter sp.]|uniref:hypothetical protein n=1 Tax=Erythrobacter sp. TaxID=1042 RepID=UPI00261554D4|nr:hypothetical protein [Erythrobacter sp.]MDJ0977658.1 hypothetical protein [Erythrobacter sp.]
MGEIYGLYSTRKGHIQYVGQTEYSAQKRLDLTVTKALDKEPGALFEWVREEWRNDSEVRYHVLQDDIIPADLDMYEGYWNQQFGGLLNVKPPADLNRTTTEIGQGIHEDIRVLLKGETQAED